MPAFDCSCGLQHLGVAGVAATREGPTVNPGTDAESLWSKMGPGSVKGLGLTLFPVYIILKV